MRNLYHLLFFLFLAPLVISCSDDDDDDKDDNNTDNTSTSVPDTYEFDNVNYSGQTERLNLLSEMSTLMKTTRTGESITAAQLEALWDNTTNPDGKKISDKVFADDKQYFLDLFAELEKNSTAGVGAEGTAGTDGGYLFNSKGVEVEQLIEKGLMGACFYYQATSVYLEDGKMDVDNENVEDGKGTEMEHHFDEAYGYFEIPQKGFDSGDELRFWAKYCNGRNDLIGCNDKLFKAFREGRAAISNKDMVARDAAIATIKKEWELVCAATAIHYIRGGLTDIADRPKRNHKLSEAIAFVSSLKYNISRVITLEQIEATLDLIGEDLDNVDQSKLQKAIDDLAAIYGLEDVKDQL